MIGIEEGLVTLRVPVRVQMNCICVIGLFRLPESIPIPRINPSGADCKHTHIAADEDDNNYSISNIVNVCRGFGVFILIAVMVVGGAVCWVISSLSLTHTRPTTFVVAVVVVPAVDERQMAEGDSDDGGGGGEAD